MSNSTDAMGQQYAAETALFVVTTGLWLLCAYLITYVDLSTFVAGLVAGIGVGSVMASFMFGARGAVKAAERVMWT